MQNRPNPVRPSGFVTRSGLSVRHGANPQPNRWICHQSHARPHGYRLPSQLPFTNNRAHALGGAPEPRGAPPGLRRLTHVLLAARNLALVAILAGKIAPFPERLGAGS
jgi:hypothetical protein